MHHQNDIFDIILAIILSITILLFKIKGEVGSAMLFALQQITELFHNNLSSKQISMFTTVPVLEDLIKSLQLQDIR